MAAGSDYWLRDAAGRVLGPIGFPVLRDLVKAGRIAGVEQVSLDGKAWQPASSFREVAAQAGLRIRSERYFFHWTCPIKLAQHGQTPAIETAAATQLPPLLERRLFRGGIVGEAGELLDCPVGTLVFV